MVEASGPTSWWYQGFVVDLKQVIPYPAHHDQPIAPDAYRVVVVITEADGEPPQATAEPSPTVIPFPIDSNGLPIFCISELALTRLASGESTNPPSGLTPPVAAQTLIDKETADNLCVTLFGENWHMAEKSDLGIVWDDFLPDAAAYWVWDYQAAQAVQMP